MAYNDQTTGYKNAAAPRGALPPLIEAYTLPYVELDHALFATTGWAQATTLQPLRNFLLPEATVTLFSKQNFGNEEFQNKAI